MILPNRGSLKSFNFYLVENHQNLTLIDAGINHDACWDLLLQTLKTHNFSLGDISQIILTHSHEDHIGLIQRILDVHSVPIFAHKDAVYRLQREEEFFQKRIEFYSQLYDEMGCGAVGKRRVEETRKLGEAKKNEKIVGEIRTLGEDDYILGMRVIETPGHSPDHIVLLDEDRKVLFGGDHLIGHISSNALVEPDRDGNRRKTLIEYHSSLKKCLNYDFNKVYTGHGRTIHHPYELINSRLEGMDEKAEKIVSIIRSGVATASEIAQTFYRDKYEAEFSLVMSEIIGYLDYIEEKQLIYKTKKTGIWHYEV
ncbi:MBL fold metallo-hydrolase [Cytobacillus horneckiae]|uniref:MBL fold metallo-hydrolase n=1 Tax=Cytobacillus horneckiae TaxID=549687 RepID=UPI0023EF2C89|nr:MBL fold metallo-hydrolase [Cytobacillus horneckiae]